MENITRKKPNVLHNTEGGLSMETVLMYVYNDLLCVVDGNTYVVLPLLDLLTSFDTINHTVLMQRFAQAMVTTGSALEWLKSYFSGMSSSTT